MKYLLLLSLLTGCGLEQACHSTGRIVRRENPPAGSDCLPSSISPRVHDKLQYAVDLFSADATRHQVPCFRTGTIGFIPTLPKDVPPTTIGYCTHGVEVRIFTTYWQSAPATERLTLMYHELGHCALGLGHHEGEPDIMNSYLLDEVTAEKKWDELVNKMFERAKK